MDDKTDKGKPVIRRAEVLKKLNAENLQLLERGLLGDLPDRLKPQAFRNEKVPVRADISKELVVSKPPGILASCLPIVVPDTPLPDDNHTPSDDDSISPLKKSFSFRERFSRMSFFNKEKQMHEKKYDAIAENEAAETPTPVSRNPPLPVSPKPDKKYDNKSSKRFWMFRNKEIVERHQQQRPAYIRSKSFEFLPKALAEGNEKKVKLTKNASYAFGSNDSIDDGWSSTESLENLSNVYYDNDRTVYLKSFKEVPHESSNNNSSLSTATSASSGLVVNVMKTKSVQDLLDEFDKTVDMFSENYLSDCEPYTKKRAEELLVQEKRKSSSFHNIPSPRVMQVSKVNEVSADFKTELSKMLQVKRESDVARNARRGSVTDWFVLEDKAMAAACPVEETKYRRAKKKPPQRVRRISSTKYVSS